MHFKQVLLGFLSCLLVHVIKSELFTALSHLERLLQMEDDLAFSLEQYLTAQEQQLKELQKFAAEVKHAVNLARKDRPKYLGHPVNAFLLIKRFVREWPEVERILSLPSAGEENLLDLLNLYKERFPNKEDMEGAVAAIHRLQDVYNLKPSDLAEGKFASTERDFRQSVTTMELFTIGRASYLVEDYQNCVQWMLEALRLLDTKQPNSGEDVPLRAEILDHLAYAEYKLGDLRSALNHTNQLLSVDPNNSRAAANGKLFEAKLNSSEQVDTNENKQEEIDSSWLSRQPQSGLQDVDFWVERDRYKKLCRGDKVSTSYQDPRKLKCEYFRDSPLCTIKPCRIELVFTNPNIWIFRNFLNAYEIEKLKNISIPLRNEARKRLESGYGWLSPVMLVIKRATVHNPLTGELTYAHYRISKSCWLDGEDDKLVDAIDRRFEALTGLTMKTAEALQVQNYGLAGQYDPHFDFSRDLAHSSLGRLGLRNRIATFLIYMSEVEAGGATVFPYVGARLTPSKGDTVFWYNLLRSGEGDFRTRHAGCPVIAGTKWVANKWVHETGNEFRRPCSLNPLE